MLYVIPMVTTKEIFIENSQKEMRRGSKCTLQKKKSTQRRREKRNQAIIWRNNNIIYSCVWEFSPSEDSFPMRGVCENGPRCFCTEPGSLVEGRQFIFFRQRDYKCEKLTGHFFVEGNVSKYVLFLMFQQSSYIFRN